MDGKEALSLTLELQIFTIFDRLKRIRDLSHRPTFEKFDPDRCPARAVHYQFIMALEWDRWEVHKKCPLCGEEI